MEKPWIKEARNFNSLLLLLFIGLKLAGFINWTWWWVFSPVWVPFAVGFVLVLFYTIVFIISVCFKLWKKLWKLNLQRKTKMR